MDQASGGRFIFGIGVGWDEAEFNDLRVPFRERGRMSDDCIRAIRAAFTSDMPEHSGPAYAERVGVSHFIRSTFPATTPLADRELVDELRRQGIGAAATTQTPRSEELFPQIGGAVTRELVGQGCGGSASRSRRMASRAPSPRTGILTARALQPAVRRTGVSRRSPGTSPDAHARARASGPPGSR